MSSFKKYEVLSKIHKSRIIPLFYQGNIETAVKIIQSCIEAGFEVIEFTNRGEGAFHVFNECLSYCRKNAAHIALGAGSVIDSETAGLYINIGADFIVSPCFDKKTAFLCNKRLVPYIPGAATVNEIQKALKYGSDIIKLFPGGRIGGPGFVKDILAPTPGLSLMPTGGISTDSESIEEWFKAGIACLGMGSNLIEKSFIENGDFESLTKHMKTIRENLTKIS